MRIEHTEPRPLDGVRAVAFHARTRELRADPMTTAVRQATEWIIANRETVVPLRVEYDQWSDDTEVRSLPAKERVLADIFPRADGRCTIWNASATVYYEVGDTADPVPPPPTWTVDDTPEGT